jgi:hypothetical protein
MRLFKTRWFTRFARGEGLGDDRLIEAVRRAERGLVDADLGHALIKQRVARRGAGRRSGYRILITYRPKRRALFLFGFAKNERDNISAAQLRDLAAIASEFMAAHEGALDDQVAEGKLMEIDYDEEEEA